MIRSKSPVTNYSQMIDAEQQLQQDPLNLLHIFIVSRQNLIRFLYKAAIELDGHHENVIITKIVTGSTAVVGTIISLTGLILAVPTGGLSVVMTIGGTVLAATSEAAYLGSSAVKHFLNQSYMDDLDKFSQADEENLFKLEGYLQRRVEELCNNTFNNDVSLETGLGIFKEISSLTSLGCSIVRVTRVTSTAARSIRIFRVASTTVGVITLPFQIIDLGMNGHALHRNERSEKAREFRQLAHDLTIQMNNVAQLIMDGINQYEHQFQQ